MGSMSHWNDIVNSRFSGPDGFSGHDDDTLSLEEVIRHLRFLRDEKTINGRRVELRQAKALESAIDRLIGGAR